MASYKLFRTLPRKLYSLLCIVFVILIILWSSKVFNLTKNSKKEKFLVRRGTVKHLKNKTKDTFIHIASRETTVLKRKEGNVNIVILIKNSKNNPNLQPKFKVLIESISRKSSISLCFHVICDEDGKTIAIPVIERAAPTETQIIIHDITIMTQKVKEQISQMQTFFSHSSKSYYGDPLFFLSIVLHRVIPLDKVIMLDVDLKFDEDIRLLYNIFDEFSERSIIGIARENQPVYRHLFHQYRGKNPSTRVGAPPPDGLTGFNSGVLLLDLEKMRKSQVYNSLIDSPKTLETLTQKYLFKGHLGDQDFYTLVSMEHEDLFHILPCSWNRQLCVWWRDHGYGQVFDQYYTCSEQIKVYHGNCNSDIPALQWERQ